MELIKKEYSHWKLSPRLNTAFRACMAPDGSNKYALNCLEVKGDCIVATEGQKLLCVKTVHKIPEGLYCPTCEGYLLPRTGAFPNWKDIIPKRLPDITPPEIEEAEDQIFDMIAYAINRAGKGIYFNVRMMRGPIESLVELGAEFIRIEAEADNPDTPIKITGTLIGGATFVYLQMQINKKGES